LLRCDKFALPARCLESAMNAAAPTPDEIRDLADRGLYAATQEHDACGVGFVAHIKGTRRTPSSCRA
jgi:hypothetical protein